MQNKKLKKLVISAMFTALTFLGTCVSIPLPVGNVNAGDAILLLSALRLGGLWSIAAASVGAALGDLAFGFFPYLPATLVIKALMTAVTLGILRLPILQKHAVLHRFFAGVCAELVMTGGYWLFESVVIYQSFYAALAGIPFNLLQGAFAVLLFLLLSQRTQKRTDA